MKNLLKNILVLFAICFLNSTNAQTTFQKSFGGSGSDDGSCVKELPGGGYMVLGSTTTYTGSFNDFYLTKLDAAGAIVWNKTYGMAGIGDNGYDMALTSDGGYILVGATGASTAVDMLVIKVDVNGVLQWSRTIDRAGTTDQAFAVAQSSDGGYAIAGTTRIGTSGGDTEYYMVKLDNTGALLWTHTYGKGTGSDNLEGMKITSDGGYVLVGTTFNTFGGTSFGAFVVKTDGNGVTQWANAYATPATGGGTNECRAVDISIDGNIIVSTETDNAQTGGGVDCIVFKLDNLGNTIWIGNSYGWPSPSSDMAWSIAKSADGGSVELGQGIGTFMNGDVFLIKRDALGMLQWAKSYGGTARDVGWSVQQTNDGGYIIVGQTQNFGSTGNDIYLIKTDSNGNSGCNEVVQTPPTAAVTMPATAGFISSTGGTAVVSTPTETSRPFPTTDVVHCSVISTLPVATFSASASSICTGSCINFTDISSGSPTAWSWLFPGATTTSSSLQNPTSICYPTSGTYTVTLEATFSGGTATSTQSIVVNVLPTITSTSSGNITCTTPSISLTGTSTGSTMLWNGGALINAANPATVNAAGTYTVTSTNSTTGCTNTSTITITSNTTPPSVTSASSGLITCTTSSATLTGTSAGSSMVWNGGALSSAANPATVSAAGTYTVTATDPTNGCTNTSTVVVTTNTTPPTVSSASSNNIDCITASATLTGTSSGTMVWNGGSLVNAANPATVTAAGTYTVTSTDATNGCTATSTITVTASGALPNISIASPSQITCTTSSVTLTGSSTTPGVGYQWSGGPASATNNVSSAGTYTLTVTDLGTGCTSQQTVVVTTNTTPPSATSGSPLVLGCTPTSGTISASSTATGATYSWTGTGIVSGGTTSSPTVNATGTYTVTITDPANGCTATTTVTVTSNTTAPNATAGSGLTLDCITSSGTINASSTTSGATFNWTGTGITAGGTTSSPTVNTSGTYTVTVTNPTNGCTATTTVSVTSNISSPNITAGASALISCSSGIANVSASSTTTGATYSWSGPGVSSGGTTSTPTVNLPGTYTVTITDPTNGCTSSSTVVVGTSPGPIANAGADVTIISGTSSTLTATGGGTYLWNTGETTNTINVSPTITTDYCVTVTDINGCTDSACVRVTVDLECGELFLPNAFSPNNDGVNDAFRLLINPECVIEMQLLVFDRWGEKIIEITDPINSWDGTYKGKQLDNAVFVYYLKLKTTNSTELIKQNGNVSLIK